MRRLPGDCDGGDAQGLYWTACFLLLASVFEAVQASTPGHQVRSVRRLSSPGKPTESKVERSVWDWSKWLRTEYSEEMAWRAASEGATAIKLDGWTKKVWAEWHPGTPSDKVSGSAAFEYLDTNHDDLISNEEFTKGVAFSTKHEPPRPSPLATALASSPTLAGGTVSSSPAASNGDGGHGGSGGAGSSGSGDSSGGGGSAPGPPTPVALASAPPAPAPPAISTHVLGASQGSGREDTVDGCMRAWSSWLRSEYSAETAWATYMAGTQDITPGHWTSTVWPQYEPDPGEPRCSGETAFDYLDVNSDNLVAHDEFLTGYSLSSPTPPAPSSFFSPTPSHSPSFSTEPPTSLPPTTTKVITTTAPASTSCPGGPPTSPPPGAPSQVEVKQTMQRWSKWLRSQYTEPVAWETFSGMADAIPENDWILSVWPQWPWDEDVTEISGRISFEYLDTNDDKAITHHEFTRGYLLGTSPTTTSAPKSRTAVLFPRPHSASDPQPPSPSPSPTPLPTLSPSNGGVAMHIKVRNIDYTRLTSDMELSQAFEAAVKKVLASAARSGVVPADISLKLSPGSVLVDASIPPPAGVSADILRSNLQHTDESLGDRLAGAVRGVDGITGVSLGTIEVDDISLDDAGSPSFWTPPVIAGLAAGVVALSAAIALSVYCCWCGKSGKKTYRSLPTSEIAPLEVVPEPETATNSETSSVPEKQPLLKAAAFPNSGNSKCGGSLMPQSAAPLLRPQLQTQPQPQPPNQPQLPPLVPSNARTISSTPVEPAWHYRLRPVMRPAAGLNESQLAALLPVAQGQGASPQHVETHPFAVPLASPPAPVTTVMSTAVPTSSMVAPSQPVGVQQLLPPVTVAAAPPVSASIVAPAQPVIPTTVHPQPVPITTSAPPGHIVAPVEMPAMPAVAAAAPDPQMAQFESLIGGYSAYYPPLPHECPIPGGFPADTPPTMAGLNAIGYPSIDLDATRSKYTDLTRDWRGGAGSMSSSPSPEY